MSNMFSSPPLLDALASVIFRGRHTETVVAEIEGHRFRLLLVDGRPAVEVPFIDFYEPLSSDEPADATLDYLPAVSLVRVSSETWQEQNMAVGYQAAPHIDWRLLESFDEYVRKYRGSKTHRKARRRVMMLDKEVGPIEWRYHEPDHRVLDICMNLKSAQYRQSRYLDVLAPPRFREWFHTLLDVGLLRLSTLRAGGKLVAISAGAEWENRYYDWLTSYDAAYEPYSPGTVLRDHLLKDSFAMGHDEFDCLIGDESYKFRYATHVRLVESLGRSPLPTRLWRSVRPHLLAPVRRSAGLHRGLQTLKREVRQRLL